MSTSTTPSSSAPVGCCGNAGESCETVADCCDTASNICAKTCYFQSTDLGRFGEIGRSNPALAAGFFDYYGKVMEDNRLTKREKSLISLAVAHVLRCAYCIDSVSHSCMAQGLSEAEMMEAVHVGAAMAAGVTLVHSTQLLGHVDRQQASA